MCGICGEIRFDGDAASLSAVEAMTHAMTSRGPDSSGLFAQGRVALGHVLVLDPEGTELGRFQGP